MIRPRREIESVPTAVHVGRVPPVLVPCCVSGVSVPLTLAGGTALRVN